MSISFSSRENHILYENRFCYQEDFDIVISGNYNDLENTEVRSTVRINYSEFKEIQMLYSSTKYTNTEVTVCERSNIWIICRKGTLHKNITEVKDVLTDAFKIYLDKTDQSIKPIEIPDNRVDYSVCSLMKTLYVFGGYNEHSLRSCLKYDTITTKWSYIDKMNSYRQLPGCTVFEGKVVVTGGYYNVALKSVESYDHHENKWSNLPDMINGRCRHGAVSMGNKMFVVGGNYYLTCEVFDNSSRKFTSTKELLVVDNGIYYDTSAVSIGYKILVFIYSSNANNKCQIYNVLKDQWCLKENDFIEAKQYISCSKLSLV